MQKARIDGRRVRSDEQVQIGADVGEVLKHLGEQERDPLLLTGLAHAVHDTQCRASSMTLFVDSLSERSRARFAVARKAISDAEEHSMSARQWRESRPPEAAYRVGRIRGLEKKTQHALGLEPLAVAAHAESRSMTTLRKVAFEASKS